MKPLEIFKAGKHTASDGRPFTFTEAQVREAVESYDPELHEAPIVIGHPTGAAPAYGWVKGLALDKKAGGIVIADPHQVEPQFEEMVKTGRFKKRSAAFYLADTPGNPTPGKLYLHHVAFLGAKPPAVKGLKDAEFSADATGIAEFTDWYKRDSAALWRRLRDFFISEHGLEKADDVLPAWTIDALQAEAAKETDTGAVAYSEHQQENDVDKEQLEEAQRKLKAAQDKLAADRAEFAERDKTLRANETAAQLAARRQECATFVDAQVKEGRVLPAQRDGLVAFMAALPAEGIVEFGEGDKAVKKPSAEWLKGYLGAQPKVVDFAERGAGGAERIDTSNPEKAGQEIAKRAVEFQEAEKNKGRIVSIDVAVQHVTSQQGAQ